jgi:hypothetical protein
MKTEKQSETTKSPSNWRDELNAKGEPIYGSPTEKQSETTKLHFEYVLSAENTPKILQLLEQQIAIIKNCDVWRAKNGIESLKYDVSYFR